ncbi:MAG: amidohydrolase [Rhizobiaceae bacterium]|nr:amidohydrolase [Rhizobiaceae bacterium]
MISKDWFDQNLPEMVAIRQDLHAHPEIGLKEFRTSQIVYDQLVAAGVEAEREIGVTGVVGTIKGDRPGPTIGLRADMDALPIVEQTDVPYASTNGLMHACGHDGHTTMLLTAARWLSANRDFAGTVHLIFQPAEEGRGGAQAMLKDGLFERFPCDMIFGLHTTAGMPVGRFGIRDGAMLAAADQWKVIFRGRGGHGGVNPHLSEDITHASAHFVLGLQGIVGRNVAPLETAVLSVGHIGAGTPDSFNVVPSELLICGTARCFSEEVHDHLEKRVRELAEGTAKIWGCTAEVDFKGLMPPLINDHACYEIALATAQASADDESLVNPELGKSTGAEDFAWMMREIPGAFMRIGNGVEADGTFYGTHTPKFNFNDDIIGLGADYWVTLVHKAAERVQSNV